MDTTEKNPSISVVIPLFDKENDVKRSLDSVLAQTFTDFEIIVVNDGSTDKGPDVVREIKDPRVRLIDQENSGVSAARNRGIQEAKADIIAFLDADDEWLPDFLSVCHRLRLNFPQAGVWATSYYFQLPGAKRSTPKIQGLPGCNESGLFHNYFEAASSSDPPICTISVTVKKSLLLEIGCFPLGVGLGEDLVVWAKLALMAQIAINNQPLAIYHRRSAEGRITPLRPPPAVDHVGNTLQNLFVAYGGVGLRAYLVRWYVMRLNLYARLGMFHHALLEFKNVVHYDLLNARAWFWLVVAATPRWAAIPLLKCLVAREVLR